MLRSLFSYLQTYGYVGANPAHSDFVAAPAAPRDGKTVGLTPEDCRRLLEAPSRDDARGHPRPCALRRACLHRMPRRRTDAAESRQLQDDRRASEFLKSTAKAERNAACRCTPRRPSGLKPGSISPASATTLPEPCSGRWRLPVGTDRRDLSHEPLARRAVQKLVAAYVRRLKLDSNVTVHSLRVTALTTAREQGSDIIDLQDFAGHADPRTTLTYIRNRDRLSKSPAYVLRY